MKTILDACCGARKCWADKKNPNAVFMDIRKENCVLSDGRTIEINPDVVADFRHIPFPDNHFHLVLFDPPHLRWAGDNSNLKKNYGRLPADWGKYIGDGFCECMRVLKPNGILIFKWNEQQIKLKTIMKYIPYEPLFGHLTGRSGHTYWMCFMKVKSNVL